MSTQAPAPEKKDEMIKHLMSRLQQSEEAIRAAEEVITHERANRKRLNADVKKANNDLRDLVEKEKKTLSDKVLAEVEKHLKQAVQEKM
jgi:DNA-binding protein Fis